MTHNRAYSAEKGYDLRTPYNVPMGEIRSMRVVEPFSISSLQKNTITHRLPFRNCGKYCPPPTIPRTLTTSRCTYDSSVSSCTGTYKLRSGRGSSTTPSKTTIAKLASKNSRIK